MLLILCKKVKKSYLLGYYYYYAIVVKEPAATTNPQNTAEFESYSPRLLFLHIRSLHNITIKSKIDQDIEDSQCLGKYSMQGR